MVKNIFPLAVFTVLFFSACENEDEFTPRPRGYYRIDMPEKSYARWDSTCPYSFEIPSYGKILPDPEGNKEPCWINLDFPRFKATLHLSYKKVDKNLPELLEQSRTLAIQHQVKASGMRENPVINPEDKVYGLIYEFSGNTASSLQVYLTDSTLNFVRGALYFWARPNADSLKPVLGFLKEDIFHMVETFRWK